MLIESEVLKERIKQYLNDLKLSTITLDNPVELAWLYAGAHVCLTFLNEQRPIIKEDIELRPQELSYDGWVAVEKYLENNKWERSGEYWLDPLDTKGYAKMGMTLGLALTEQLRREGKS